MVPEIDKRRRRIQKFKMASKVLSLMSLVLLLGIYGAQADTYQGCSWTAYAENCDDVNCPPNTREVTRGKSGVCPNGAQFGQICTKGQKKLCCNNVSSRQLQTCEWVGLAPACTLDCPQGKTMMATDAWGRGNKCDIGCKFFCCNMN